MVVLCAVVLAIAAAHVAPVAGADGPEIMILDVCSIHPETNTADMTALTDHVFDIQHLKPETRLLRNTSETPQFLIPSRIEKPPKA